MARNRINHLIRDGFYSESTVRKLCADVLQILPQADENGLIEKDGEIWGTIKSLARLLGVSASSILSRIRKSSPKSIRGKGGRGQLRDFYSLSAVQRLCADLLQDFPQADENGFFEKDGENWGTVESLSRLLGVSTPSIKSRIRKSSPKPIRGKDKMRRVHDFYRLSAIRRLCADLLGDFPQAAEDDLFKQDGETYGTIFTLSRLLGISFPTIKSRMQKTPLKPIQGKSKIGAIQDFYALSDVRVLCQDLIQDLPQADKNGFFEQDGETYGSLPRLARHLDIAYQTIRSRMRKNPLKPIQAKSRGRVSHFYPENAVRKLCADLISKKSKK